ncbi:MAG: type II secretion system F family protein [bacterium]|nr:type II secretion system F family protein [bacterium]
MSFFTLKKKIVFFQQFASLTKSGIGILPTLDHLQRYARGPLLPVIVKELQAAARQNQQLSVVFKKYELYFGKFPVALIKSGEISGHLPENAQVIAAHLEDTYKNINRLLIGIAYPVILLHLFILITPAAVFFTCGPLAYLTQVFTKFLFLYGSAAVIYFTYLITKTTARPAYDQVKLYLPVIGKLLKNLSIYKFLRGFAAMYQSGMNSIESWQVAAELTDNTYLTSRIIAAKHIIDQGRPLTQAFEQAGIFPAEVVDMVNTGETSGNIDGMLVKAAEYLDESIQRTMQVILRLVPVLVYLIIAVIIGYSIISGYLSYWAEIDKVLK